MQANVTIVGAKSLSVSEKSVKHVLLRVQLGHEGERVTSGLLPAKGKEWNWSVELDSLSSSADTNSTLKATIFEVSDNNSRGVCLGMIKFDLLQQPINTNVAVPVYERVTAKMVESHMVRSDSTPALRGNLSEKGTVTLRINRLTHSLAKYPSFPAEPTSPSFYNRSSGWFMPVSRVSSQEPSHQPSDAMHPSTNANELRYVSRKLEPPSHRFLMSVATITRAMQILIDVALYSDLWISCVLALAVWVMITTETVALYGSLGMALFYLMRVNKYLKATSYDKATVSSSKAVVSSSTPTPKTMMNENPFSWHYPGGSCFLMSLSRYNCIVHDPVNIEESSVLFERLVNGIHSLDWSLAPLIGFLASALGSVLSSRYTLTVLHLGYFVGLPVYYYLWDLPALVKARQSEDPATPLWRTTWQVTRRAIRARRPVRIATASSPSSVAPVLSARGNDVLRTQSSTSMRFLSNNAAASNTAGQTPPARTEATELRLLHLENAELVSSGQSTPRGQRTVTSSPHHASAKGTLATTTAMVHDQPKDYKFRRNQAQMCVVFEFEDMTKKVDLMDKLMNVCGQILSEKQERARKKESLLSSVKSKIFSDTEQNVELLSSVLALGADLASVRRSLRCFLTPPVLDHDGTPRHLPTLSFDLRSLDTRAAMRPCDYVSWDSLVNAGQIPDADIAGLQQKVINGDVLLPAKPFHHPPAVESSLCVAAVVLQLTSYQTIPIFSKRSNPYFTVMIPVEAPREGDRDVTHWPPPRVEMGVCPGKLQYTLFSQWEISKERRMPIEYLGLLLQHNLSKCKSKSNKGVTSNHARTSEVASKKETEASATHLSVTAPPGTVEFLNAQRGKGALLRTV